MPIAYDETYRVTVSTSLPESSAIQNVYNFRITGQSGSAAVDASFMSAMETYFNALYDNIQAYLSSSLSDLVATVDQIDWDSLSSKWQTIRRVGDFILDVGVGTAADILPPGVAALITQEGLYRSHKGKKYFGGLNEGVNQPDGTILPALVEALTTINVALLGLVVIPGAPEDMTAHYVILNQTLGTYIIPTSAEATNRWSSQRRRKKFYGL